MKVFFKKVEDKDESFRIKAEFVDNSIILFIIKDNNSWTSQKILEPEIKNKAEILNIPFEDYYNKLIEVFKGTTEAKLLLKEKSFEISFSLENDINIKYFSCDIFTINYKACIEEILDNFFIERLSYIEQNKEFKQKIESLTNTVDSYRCEIKQNQDNAKTYKEKIFNNFARLLNEKKLKIQHLTESLEVLREKNFNSGCICSPMKKDNVLKKTDQHHNISDSNEESSTDEDGYNSDDENNKRLKENNLRTIKSYTSAISLKNGVNEDIFHFDEMQKNTNVKEKHLSNKRKSVESADNIYETKISTPSTSTEKECGIKNKKSKLNNTSNNIPVEINTQDWLGML